ncbi:gluconokinase [Qipengyuania sphaerica]|uniref:gluconokinase n=1 Tax=Qipengyuania sphaerica TaxID=2867243 RepID=UPI001C872FC4|nr:gluconokinase [Qipengyuania sphaerica]MBX7541248.1 gluconokinase [Qipengyuania sphaerica]
MKAARLIVIAGVSGSGKSTVGRGLAERLGLHFLEGDDFHGPANVAKMASGKPLQDSDRKSWIEALCHASNAHSGDVVVSCSALSRQVRDWIRSGSEKRVIFLLLQASEETLTQRLSERRDHFMPASLLASQLAAWEMGDDLLVLDAEGSPLQIIGQAELMLASSDLP